MELLCQLLFLNFLVGAFSFVYCTSIFAFWEKMVDYYLKVWYTNGRRKTRHGVNRLVTWRYEFAIIATWVLDRIVAWPHLWPSTASDYVETVRTRASESIVFGLKSIKKSTKVVKKRWRICSGPRGRVFESPHSDQKKFTDGLPSVIFLLCSNMLRICDLLRHEPIRDQGWASENNSVSCFRAAIQPKARSVGSESFASRARRLCDGWGPSGVRITSLRPKWKGTVHPFLFVLLNSRICLGRFLSSTAHQFLRFERRWLTIFLKYGILTAEEKLDTGWSV